VLLTGWWNDGRVMEHAGFADGLHTTEKEVAEKISQEDDQNRRMILELGRQAIGEMNYRTKGRGTAEVGIKICDSTLQEKGYGTRFLTLLFAYLFEEAGYERVILDTKRRNKRAQHVYENKLGFQRTKVTDEIVAYELTVSEFRRRMGVGTAD